MTLNTTPMSLGPICQSRRMAGVATDMAVKSKPSEIIMQKPKTMTKIASRPTPDPLDRGIHIDGLRHGPFPPPPWLVPALSRAKLIEPRRKSNGWAACPPARAL